MDKVRSLFGANTKANIYIELYYQDRPLDYILVCPCIGAALAECAIKASEEVNSIDLFRDISRMFSVRSPHCFGDDFTASLTNDKEYYCFDIGNSNNIVTITFPLIGRKIIPEEIAHQEIVKARTYEGWNKAKESLFGKVIERIENLDYIGRVAEEEYLSFHYSLCISNSNPRLISYEAEYISALKKINDLRSQNYKCYLTGEIEPIITIICRKDQANAIKNEIHSIF